MNRIGVVLVTAAATLALTAAFTAAVFRVRPAGGDGFMLLYGTQAEECETGGGCAILSEREFKAAVYSFLLKIKRKQQDQGLSS